MKKEPYTTPFSPTMPCTRGMPIKPALLKMMAKRSTFRRSGGSFRKAGRLSRMLRTMASAEMTVASSSSRGSKSPPERKESMIKQGVTTRMRMEVISAAPRSVSSPFLVMR